MLVVALYVIVHLLCIMCSVGKKKLHNPCDLDLAQRATVQLVRGLAQSIEISCIGGLQEAHARLRASALCHALGVLGPVLPYASNIG